MLIRFDRSLVLQTAAAAFLLFNASFPAWAQNSDVPSRLTRMENEIQTLSRAVFKGETPPPGSFSGGDSTQADMQNRLTQMESDLRTLTGKIEEQGYEITRLKEMESRVIALEGRAPGSSGAGDGAGMSTYSAAMPAQPPIPPQGQPPEDGGFSMSDPDAPAPANAPTTGQFGTMITTIDHSGGVYAPPGSPASDYEAAYTMLRNQDYANAAIAFEKFIKDNPDNSLTPNAMYWLGETHYVRNEFEPAAKIFAEAYQKYPKGAKAPDNLLKLAMSLVGMGKTRDACVALGQLKKEYPAGYAPVLSRADQEITRLGCGGR
jgi:tol-pal system protein YbgF